MNEPAVEIFLFVGLPYLSVALMIGGTIWRWRKEQLGWSSLSSQFLESRWLLWGAIPFHAGIGLLLVGHLVPLLFPSVWQALVARSAFLVAVEIVGLAAALLAAAGLLAFLARRLTSPRVQAVTTVMDVVILGLLLGQVLVGIGVALLHRWGAVWSAGTTTPYLWSLLALQPEPALIAGLPPLVRLHLIGAWLIAALLPFTRLVHMLSLPLGYLVRPPQKVVWAGVRRFRGTVRERRVAQGRRMMVKGIVGTGVAGLLLSIGVLDKLVRYFRGPEMTPDEEAGLLKKRLERLEMTAEERELELERMRNDAIRVASLAELSPTRGKYFIDYRMRPALAFLDADGMPLLISAKCTHLGCTVSSELDERRRLLCPCHVSYFDLDSGVPNAGSPAKQPLPHIAWVLRDPAGEVVAARSGGGPVDVDGAPPPGLLAECDVWIVRPREMEMV